MEEQGPVESQRPAEGKRQTPSQRGENAPSRSAKGGPAPSRLSALLRRRHDPLTSLLLTIPVFLVYHLGILLMDLRNGVDLVSGLTFELLQYSLPAYVIATLALAAGIAVAAKVLRKRGKLRAVAFFPVLGESTLLAVLMLFSVGWAVEHLFSLQVGIEGMGPLEKLVMAAGAGFHEELVFRVAFFAGGAFLLERMTKLSALKAGLISAFVSSLIFSAIHYVGPYGDPFSIVSFTFRALSGLYLAAVYRARGFAVAVYTHTIYDLIVFFLH